MPKFIRKTALSLTLVFTAAATAIIGDVGIREALQEKHALTSDRIESAQSIFGDCIDYSKVRICIEKFSSLQSSDAIIVIGNTIYFPPTPPPSSKPPPPFIMSAGYASNAPKSKNVFMHELTHVWQNQNNIKATGIPGAFSLLTHSQSDKGVYAYKIDGTKALTDYNMEQQAEIISDYASMKAQLAKNPKQKPSEDYLALQKIVERSIPAPRKTLKP